MRSTIGSVDHVLHRGGPHQAVCPCVTAHQWGRPGPGCAGRFRAVAGLNGDLPSGRPPQASPAAGWASARHSDCAAFVASRIMCRPLVSTMVDHFSLAFGVANQLIMAEYDARTDAALTRLVSTLPPTRPSFYWDSLTKPWLIVSFLAQRPLWDRGRHPSLRHARGITPDDGDGDDEHPLARKREDPVPRHHLRRHERASGPASDA